MRESGPSQVARLLGGAPGGEAIDVGEQRLRRAWCRLTYFSGRFCSPLQRFPRAPGRSGSARIFHLPLLSLARASGALAARRVRQRGTNEALAAILDCALYGAAYVGSDGFNHLVRLIARVEEKAATD